MECDDSVGRGRREGQAPMLLTHRLPVQRTVLLPKTAAWISECQSSLELRRSQASALSTLKGRGREQDSSCQHATPVSTRRAEERVPLRRRRPARKTTLAILPFVAPDLGRVTFLNRPS